MPKAAQRAILTSPRHSGHKGFTLIELMVVVVILGILFSIAIPNYIRAQENAKLAECKSNQRNLATAATVYAMDNGIVNGVVNSGVLTADGYAIAPLGECPSSEVFDNDDYDVDIVDGVGSDATCLIRGNDHPWEPL